MFFAIIPRVSSEELRSTKQEQTRTDVVMK
jgi:hypothetical protein